ncbi:MAG: M48 family metallopeptidase [Anaerolineaceae bacterium]
MSPTQIDEIIRTHRKSIAIIVQHSGKVIVRAPLRTSQRQIMNFVNEKSDWITETLEKIKKNPLQPPTHRFEEGEKFWYLGQQFPLNFVSNQKIILHFDHRFLLKRDHLPSAKSILEKWYKNQARSLLTDRTAFYAQKYGFAYKKINITSARTRWGSCSTNGSISFTWRLVMAPVEVIDYVIIHELVHTRVHNHSQQFWDQVEKILPDFRKMRLWLKKNGTQLRFD